MLDLADFTTLWDHSVAWGIYLVAALVVLLAYWQLTRRWQIDVRWLVFTLLAVFLLVPAPVPGGKLLAPAMIMLVLSPFTGSHELIAGVLARLVLAAAAVIALVVAAGVVRHVRLRHR